MKHFAWSFRSVEKPDVMQERTRKMAKGHGGASPIPA
jgi:hypothetical protein